MDTEKSVNGYFAVLMETMTDEAWSFYKAPSGTRARTMALSKNDCLDVHKVVMITKAQYDTGRHNLKILNKRKNAHTKRKCVSRLTNQ